jgi:hypothetical protein
MRPFVGRFVTVAAAVSLFSGPALALDRFEPEDNDSGTDNQLVHGVRNSHDFEGSQDQDWMFVITQAGHSYEVRSYAHNGDVNMGPLGGGSLLERVDAAGVVLQNGVDTAGDIGYHHLVWTGTGAKEFIRISNVDVKTATAQYDVDFFDTTYLVSRWNNSGAQITVFVIQNASAAAVTGNIDFFNAAGTLLATQPLNVPVNGTQVFNTASLPALVGASGSARIANDGTWGALAGKAVAVEASTGFTFDTLISPIVR